MTVHLKSCGGYTHMRGMTYPLVVESYRLENRKVWVTEGVLKRLGKPPFIDGSPMALDDSHEWLFLLGVEAEVVA